MEISIPLDMSTGTFCGYVWEGGLLSGQFVEVCNLIYQYWDLLFYLQKQKPVHIGIRRRCMQDILCAEVMCRVRPKSKHNAREDWKQTSHESACTAQTAHQLHFFPTAATLKAISSSQWQEGGRGGGRDPSARYLSLPSPSRPLSSG